MEFLNNTFTMIADFLGKGWIPNLFAIIGGILGFWSFIDSYLFKFKPKIYIGTRIIVQSITERGRQNINSIICSLEICNHRKKYGVIYDFAIRIYKSQEINPNDAIYYASKTVDKITVNVEELEEQEYQIFNPVTVLPDSNSSVNIILSDLLYRSQLGFDSMSNYHIEIYYQQKPKGKWYFIDQLYLYNDNSHKLEVTDSEYVTFTVLNSSITREKLKEKIKPVKTDLYKGITHRFLNLRYKTYSYKFIRYPFDRLMDVFITIPFYSSLFIKTIFDKFVKVPIIKLQGKKALKANFTFGSPESKPITEKAFDQIFTKFQKLAEKLNTVADKDVQIKVSKDESNHIIICRYKLNIKIYMSGDKSFYVQELSSFKDNSKLRYQLTLKGSVWKKNYWYLENSGFVSLDSFVIRVMDALVMHSNTN